MTMLNIEFFNRNKYFIASKTKKNVPFILPNSPADEQLTFQLKKSNAYQHIVVEGHWQVVAAAVDKSLPK